jgi:DNA invertase Pin-like site-specific DNA recombinase
MMMAFAEEEARQIRSRTQKALAERRKNGSPMGAEHPNSRNLTNEAAKRGRAAGLIERRRLSNAEYHFILPDMADWRDREKLSLRAIANRLNGMKRRTIQGKPWTAGTVANVLGRAEL